ncbi:ABC transporter, ATP-binding protein [Corynebacterium amycolatum SK46]|nr:ABC transporter, ATP-binding protein [Corynebacterium amycolatum SK46]
MSIYGVIGPNGAGKTYYLHTLAQMPTAALAKAAPDTQIFGATPREYFHILRTGWDQLDVSHAESLLDFPADTPIKQLSLGQRQLLIAATALASGKDALLFDEPFNGLDVEHRTMLRGMLIDAAESADIVVTSQHSQDLADLVDTLIVIHKQDAYGPHDVEKLRATHPVLRGPTDLVAQVTGPVLAKKTLGERCEAILATALTASAAAHARALGVDVSYLDPAALIDLASTSVYVERSKK